MNINTTHSTASSNPDSKASYVLHCAALLLILSVAWPACAAPYSVNADGTVTDSSTSLVWDRCPYGRSGSNCATGTAFLGTWQGALAAAVAANSVSYKGFSDWRVPNRNELESLVEIDRAVPTIDSAVFPNTPPDWFWSSTGYALNQDGAWHVHFYDGDSNAYGKTNTYYVRLVRSGQSLASCDSLGGCNGTPTTPLPQMPTTPPLDAPTARNLVIVTHGWNSDTTAWPNALVDAICNKHGFPIRATGTGAANVVGVDHSCKSPGSADWVVYAYNWSPDAVLAFDNAHTPNMALANAQQHGDDLATKLWGLANDGSKSWDVVHLIGHSAGAGFVQSFARKVKRLSQVSGQAVPKIHATFLDAYCPNPWGCSYGVAADGEPPAADLAEQYVDTRNVLASWVPGTGLFDEFTLGLTNITLPNAFNFDITALDNKGPLEYGLLVYPADFHALPYRYYIKTAGVTGATLERFNAYTVDSLGFGAGWAPWSQPQTGDVWSATLANYVGFSKGDRCVMAKTLDLGLGNCNPSFTQRWLHIPAPVNSLNLQTVACHADLVNTALVVDTCAFLGLQGAASGSMHSLAASAAALAAPPDPGMALLRVNLAQPANRIKFDYRFTQTGSGGGMQMFVQDDKMIFVTLQNAGDTSMHSTNWIDIPTLTAGDQSLRVVVRPMGNDSAGVEVSNIQFENVALADFPDGGVVPAGWTQPVGSNAPWAVASDAAYAGTFSLKSGVITHSQKSELSYSANFLAGNVSFARKVSSEANYDFLQFYVDGVLQNGWSGELDWATVSFPITAGWHTLLWRYLKDGSVSAGSDAAWIDSITLPGIASPIAQTIGAISFSPTTLTVGGTTASATASSGLPVSFNSSTPSVCTASGINGSTVTALGVGTCNISANQAGNASYAAAVQMIQTITVGKGSQTIGAITLLPPTLTVGGTTTASATASSGLPVFFSSTTPSICTVNGNTVTGVAIGTCTIVAYQAGDSNYLAATSSRSIVVTNVANYLAVAKSGTGSGIVTSSPAGINCGATCSASFATGTSVTLVAIPTSGSDFTGWSGACTGTASCVVSMSTAQSVVARFASAAIGAIAEFPVSAAPFGITAGPDGNLWFTELYANRIGTMTTSGTVIAEYLVPTVDAQPYHITAGPDGNLWFTEFRGNKIGKITTAGAIAEYFVPTPNASLDHIAVGPDGNLWFTEQGGNKIGKITTTGTITEYPIASGYPHPADIAVGPDGNLWFTEFRGSRIGKITTAGVITEYPTTGFLNPYGIVAGPDGNLWFTESNGSKIGKITTTGQVTEYVVPTANAGIWAITSGRDGNLWFTESGGNKVGKITTAGVITESLVLPTPDSGSFVIITGPDRNLWFTETRANKIGKIAMPKPKVDLTPILMLLLD